MMHLPDERGKVRAADADRDRVMRLLNTAYTEGRLSKDEYDARLGSAFPHTPAPIWTRS
jgi:hypothetical protein